MSIRDFHHIRTHWDVLRELSDSDSLLTEGNTQISQWNVGTQLSHIGTVTLAIASRVEEILAKPSQGAGMAVSPATVQILTHRTIPRGLARTPIEPPATVTRTDLIRLFDAAEKTWTSLSSKHQLIEGCLGTAPHPILGPLPAAGWVTFCAIHTDHHLAIIQDMVASSVLNVDVQAVISQRRNA